jgi:signal transduction histidine kinase
VFRTTHIRTKLAVALAVPLAALVAVAGFEVVKAADEVDEVRAQSELATSSIGPGSLLIHLQDERNRAAIDLIGLGDAAGLPVADNAEARALVDDAAPQLRALLESDSAEVEASFAPAWSAFEGLDELRADIDAYDGPMDVSNDELADEVFGRYTDIIESFFDGTSTIARSVEDVDLRKGVAIVDAAARQSEMRARIVRGVVLAVVTGQLDAPASGQGIAALYDRAQGFDAEIAANASGPYAGIAEATFSEAAVQSFNAQVQGFLDGQVPDLSALLASIQSDPDSAYIGLRARAADALAAEATDIEDEATQRQQAFAGIALGALLLALLVTWLASRSITRPLRSLRGQAEEMAGNRLPAAVRQILETPPGEDVIIPAVEPITVSSRDEVAEVASALSAVQASALDLAVEQAVLRRNISDSYINLGRRNQNLLSRQLDFITELERNESDPDALEGLFKLDHLATRMRRNAESLLVLAGIDPPRQWSAPVKLSDVVRAALGEVEDYQRVVVRHLEPASMTGSVAADLAHVLAELIENALSFSPPDEHVEVKGRLTTGGYTLAVTDNGLGMTPEDLERANRRLAGAESFTVAPSRYLGHYVAGHLAARLGVVVELQDSPAGGITARVDVPMGLLVDDELEPGSAARPAPAASAPAPAVAPIEVSDDAVQRLGAGLAAAAGLSAADVAEREVDAPSVTASGLPRRGSRTPSVDLDREAEEASAAPTAAASVEAAAVEPTAEPVVDPLVEPERLSGPAHFAGRRPLRRDVDADPAIPAVQPDPETEPEWSGTDWDGADWHGPSTSSDPDAAPQGAPELPAPAEAEVEASSAGSMDRDRMAPSWDTLPSAAPEPASAASAASPAWEGRMPAWDEPWPEPVAATAAPERTPEPAPEPHDQQPAPVGQTRGFGGIPMTQPGASMYTVVAKNAREARENGMSPDAGTTSAGLARRVPGAQRPDAGFGTPKATTSTPAADDESTRTTPEDVYSFLSSFQSGVARGRADAQTDTDPFSDTTPFDVAAPTEDDR